MAHIEIGDYDLLVHLDGLEKLYTLHNKLRIPLAHVSAVSVGCEAVYLREPADVNFLGVYRPGKHVIGTVRYRDGRGNVFCDYKDPARAVRIDLDRDHYASIMIEPSGESPEELAARIREAVGMAATGAGAAEVTRPSAPGP